MGVDNFFTKRAERAAKILSCYSNVGDCIPQTIMKAKETDPLKKEPSSQKGNGKKVSKEELAKAKQDADEAMEILMGGNKPGKEKRELAKKIVCKAFDDGLIDEDEFLASINKIK